MPKKGSINFQLIERMKSMTHFGESKHEAKKNNINEAKSKGIKINSTKVDGIYSYNTFEAYKQTSKEFSIWLKENYSELKDINKIERKHVIEYLQHRQNSNCSAWTIDKDKSALNKVLGMDITKKEANLKQRKLKDISRSRNIATSDKKYNEKNYADQITIAKNTGIRRQSMDKITPSDFVRDTKGDCIALNVKEKGGRVRTIPILKSGQGAVTDVVNKAQESDKPLFSKYTKMIDNHAYRGEYATNYYKQLQEENNKPLDYKDKYNKENLRAVSNALGHNRISVVVDHYLRDR